MTKDTPLSEKVKEIFKNYIYRADIHDQIVKVQKEAVKKSKLEEEDYELKVIGLVWGLCTKKEFDVEYFNIKMKEFGMNHRKNNDKIFGEFK